MGTLVCSELGQGTMGCLGEYCTVSGIVFVTYVVGC